MSVVDGQPVNETITNAAFLSRLTDSDTVGMIGLLRAASGANVTDIQKLLNYLIAVSGMTSESNNSLDYSSNTVITDGDSLKTAAGKLDAAHAALVASTTQTQNDLDAAEAAIIALQSAGGGGGGGALKFLIPAGSEVTQQQEGLFESFFFPQNSAGKVVALVPVPTGWTLGANGPPRIRLVSYTSGANNHRWRVDSFYIQANVDFAEATLLTNQSDSSDRNVGAGIMSAVNVDFTAIDGKIGGTLITGGNYVRIEISRIAPAGGTEAITDARLIAGALEVMWK